MAKYLSVILGIAAIGLGLWGMRVTWPLFWRAIQAVIPALCVLGGLLAVIVGVGEIRDSLTAQSSQPPQTDSESKHA